MKKLLLTIMILLANISGAQDKTEYYKVTLGGQDEKYIPMPFYIKDVYDGRQFKDNIGTIQKGLTNRKVLAQFERPLETEVKDYLTKVFPQKEGQYPVSVRINDLYISEYTDKNTETGYAAVIVDVIVEKDNQQYIVGTYGANIDGEGMDVTAKHPERIKLALNKCLGRFEVAPEEDKVNIPFDNSAIARKAMGIPAKGAYLSYVDMINNKPADDSKFFMTNKDDKYYLTNKLNRQKVDNYYAYSDGETVYLNVSRYASSKYYAKTERIADKYFIDNIAYDQNRMISLVAMYQLVGYLGNAIVSDTTMPMLIDCYSGQPFFLSNSDIKTLLTPYPDLLKEYKKGNKTPQDIKAVLTKYYAIAK